MALHYSIKSFFRVMPAPVLSRYFQKQGLFNDVDFVSPTGAKLDELFEAWLSLPEGERKRIEGEFQEIFALSRDAAMPAIIQEAAWQMRNEPEVHAAFVDKNAMVPA